MEGCAPEHKRLLLHAVFDRWLVKPKTLGTEDTMWTQLFGRDHVFAVVAVDIHRQAPRPDFPGVGATVTNLFAELRQQKTIGRVRAHE